MMACDYHDGVWRSVPEDVEPEHAELRLRFLLEHARGGARVLDVGCGDGWFLARLRKAGATAVGIDVAAEAARRARRRDPQLDVRVVAPHGPWPLPEAGFDVVWAGEVIEHVLDTAAWLSEVRRVLRAGGRLLLSTPDHPRARLLWLALSTRAFASHFDPRSDHVRFYARRSLAELLEDFGFEHISLHGAAGVPGARRVLLASACRTRF